MIKTIYHCEKCNKKYEVYKGGELGDITAFNCDFCNHPNDVADVNWKGVRE